MKKKENEVYEAPAMRVLIVELEQGIAAESGSASPDPSVKDWNGGGGGSSNGDF